MAHSAIKGRLIFKATLTGTQSSMTTLETEGKRFYLLISHLLVYFSALSRAPPPASAPPARPAPCGSPRQSPSRSERPPGPSSSPPRPAQTFWALGGPLTSSCRLGMVPPSHPIAPPRFRVLLRSPHTWRVSGGRKHFRRARRGARQPPAAWGRGFWRGGVATRRGRGHPGEPIWRPSEATTAPSGGAPRPRLPSLPPLSDAATLFFYLFILLFN